MTSEIGICDIVLTAIGAIAATYYTYRTTVPDEFWEKATRYTGIEKEDMSEIGAMDVMRLRPLSKRANKDFFNRAKGLLTGRYVKENQYADSLF